MTTKFILQPNGEITNAEGRRILDAFTYEHLKKWVFEEFTHTEQVEEKLETIVSFLSKQDADDKEVWLGRTWWEVLANAQYETFGVVNPHKA